MGDQQNSAIHSLSVVIPVYQGERTLGSILAEIAAFTTESLTPGLVPYRVTEAILVYDNGGDASDVVIRELEEQYDFVRAVWLSRNFGQHAATLAGIASTSGDWVVTLDEDGQHNPFEMAALLDAAIAARAQVVYGKPTNPPPHGSLRNAASKGAKSIIDRLFVGSNASDYNSYRLILGSVARGVAAYSGSGVYLDVALGWVAGKYTTAPVTLRSESRDSGYSLRRLLSHFWRLVISSGTRGLRVVSVLGGIFGLIGVLLAIWILIVKLTTGIDAEGWASTVIILLISSGSILFSLGVVAEYVGVNVNMAMGKPAYVITSDPEDGPLGYRKTPRR
ncbi:glycosyltransferase [Glaciihabitans sp. dw_435]|uniref:glycosyltransferase n=1 Tax=Glaciihabitans sp. dw_435 TaxID=2720081 RepID=UPI001BD4DBC0|nr:glycosyltransferase [Glaciihabitans sp. dw_435]